MDRGTHRWFVDISQWNPSQEQFTFILSLLPLYEHSTIIRFVKFEDRKRAIISRLLQYALINEVVGIPFDKIIINRTIEGKPYLENDIVNLEFPNFNFNVSHDGDYVAIVSEPLYIVGLDIVSHSLPHQETTFEFIKNFSSYLTSFEWDNIINAGTSNDILGEFYRYWCVKEAFIKAIGAGLGYGLDRLEFHHTNWTNISVHIDGEESREWKFSLFELPRGHLVSVARGHPKSAIESYKRTLRQTEFEDENNFSIELSNSFRLRTVEELLPFSLRVSYGKLTDENRKDLYLKD